METKNRPLEISKFTRSPSLEILTPTDTVSYTYSDTNWKDKLTGYDGETFTYDSIGNPITYRNGLSFTWQNGRNLETASKTGLSISYTYNSSGIRTGKTVNNITTEYLLDGSTILKGTTGNESVRYYYDASGSPVSLTYSVTSEISGTEIATDTDYYFLRNLQGDVTGLLDSTGAKVVSYSYDSWGKLRSITGIQASGIGTKNSLRYRGYCYDTETGLYYLNSRYYDPEVGRFISPDTTDVLTATPSSLTDKNLYLYCDNNSVVREDKDGRFWNFVVGATASAVISGIIQIFCNLAGGKNWHDGLLVAITTGAASGFLAASSISLVGSIVGNAAISMCGNAANQINQNNGFKNFDVGDMLIDGLIGGISGAAGGSGMGKNANIDTLNKNLTKKVFSGSANTLKNGIKYYTSQTAYAYKKFLFESLRKSVRVSIAGNMCKSLSARFIR